MRSRISINQLEELVLNINHARHGSNRTYTLSRAYGGYSLNQVFNSFGGTRDVFSIGHVPAREL